MSNQYRTGRKPQQQATFIKCLVVQQTSADPSEIVLNPSNIDRVEHYPGYYDVYLLSGRRYHITEEDGQKLVALLVTQTL